MKKARRITVNYGPRYTVFMGMMSRAEEGLDRGSKYVGDLSLEEVAMLNGYLANTGDDEVRIYQGYDLNSVTFANGAAAQRMGAYLMGRDAQ